jgi:hypothetical protein
MSAGSARLNHALKTLRERWDETKPLWNDKVSQDLEKNHLFTTEAQAVTAIRGMEKLAEVLNKVKHDCA